MRNSKLAYLFTQWRKLGGCRGYVAPPTENHGGARPAWYPHDFLVPYQDVMLGSTACATMYHINIALLTISTTNHKETSSSLNQCFAITTSCKSRSIQLRNYSSIN